MITAHRPPRGSQDYWRSPRWREPFWFQTWVYPTLTGTILVPDVADVLHQLFIFWLLWPAVLPPANYRSVPFCFGISV